MLATSICRYLSAGMRQILLKSAKQAWSLVTLCGILPQVYAEDAKETQGPSHMSRTRTANCGFAKAGCRPASAHVRLAQQNRRSASERGRCAVWSDIDIHPYTNVRV